MLDHLAASTEHDPPACHLCSLAARPGLEALADGLPTDPAVALTVPVAARAVVSVVLPASSKLLRSNLSRLGWTPMGHACSRCYTITSCDLVSVS
jgi:hypothetical protein